MGNNNFSSYLNSIIRTWIVFNDYDLFDYSIIHLSKMKNYWKNTETNACEIIASIINYICCTLYYK